MHGAAEEEMRESAALYALDALGPAESAEFEAHLSDCEVCRHELDELNAVGNALAFAVPPVPPPDGPRTRLAGFLRDLADGADGADGDAAGRHAAQDGEAPKLTIRSGEGEWRELVPGLFVKQLFVDRERRTVTSLFRLEPGARVPPHRHAGTEECLVVEGDLYTDDVLLRAGDYHCAPKGSTHPALSTVSGALFLIVAEAPAEMKSARSSHPV